MRFSLETVKIIPKACINNLTNEVICADCLEVCPVQAITLEKGIPTINHFGCIDCGACVSSCDSFAIDHIQKPYPTISQQINDFPEAKITCEQLDNYQKGIKIPCYLYLDLALVIQSSGGRNTIILYTEKCTSCSKSNNVSISLHISSLQSQLNALAIPITIQSIEAGLENKEQGLVEDQVVNGLTRRELLQMFSVKNIRKMLTEKVEDPKEFKEKKLTLGERARFKKNLLNTYWKNHLKEKVDAIPLPFKEFLEVKITDNCNGCSVCESICPTDALYWQNEVSESKLYFSTQQCIGCKKCSICPEKAISFEQINLDKYLSGNPTELISYHTKQCIECGDSFRTNKSVEICSSCEGRRDRDSKSFFAHCL